MLKTKFEQAKRGTVMCLFMVVLFVIVKTKLKRIINNFCVFKTNVYMKLSLIKFSLIKRIFYYSLYFDITKCKNSSVQRKAVSKHRRCNMCFLEHHKTA